MIRIAIPWLLEVIESFDGLNRLQPDKTVLDNLGPLFLIKNSLETVFSTSVYGDFLRASRNAAGDLYSEVTKHVNAGDWGEKTLTEYEVQNIKFMKDRVRTVFLAELSTLPSYLVSKKDNFDVNLLVESGARLFPPMLLTKAPETARDAQEVGRALAFELPTACGFHAFRVVESVVRRYWDQTSNQTPRPKLETLGNFAIEMERSDFGDVKVVESIKQMTKLHRNPLVHPEVILDVEEAIGIIGMARSVLSMMLQTLPDVPMTTTGAPSSSAPGATLHVP
jgi:hypothetical protein